MKSIFKFMTVALATGLVVSCSDELNLEKKAYTAQEGDLVGTLYAPAPTRVAMLDVLTSEGYTPVWSIGDQVNVFSSTQLNFNQYKLASGEGTPKGIFEPVETNPALLGATDLYAITEARYQYGVSAIDANSGKVKLTAEIPESFKWDKLATADAYALPSPFWGHASFGEDGLLNVGFKPLTGVLRLDLTYLPEGVNGVVLVTGNNTMVNGTYSVNGDKYYGSSEGLSGFFNTVLDYNDVENYLPLHNDRALRCYDTLRVDFREATVFDDNKVIFIPLIAQHYDNLKVIAVTEDTENPYEWGGEILRTFDDLTIENGECKDLNMTANYLLTATTPKAISEEIARLYDGKHSLVVTAPFVVPSKNDSIIYITSDNPEDVGQTSVTINIGAIVAEVPEDEDDDVEDADYGLAFVEASTENNIGLGEHTFHGFNTRYTVYDPAKAQSGEKERTVTLNFATAPAEDKYITVCLPTSNVVMSAAINNGSTPAEEVETMPLMNIITANTENVSGYDATNKNHEDEDVLNTVSNEQKAGLKFTGQYSVVNYYSGGAVYFLDVPEVNAQQSEITIALNIFGENPKSLRITDALINTITYPEVNGSDQGNNITTYIFTTGSAAIKKLEENGDKVKIQAYWTGKRLTPYSVLAGYEGTDVMDNGVAPNENYSIASGAIYTAAQLQGMGLSMDVYDYTISPKVESIWLGGKQFPWIGAQIKDHDAITLSDYALANAEKLDGDDMAKISEAFTLDGRNVTLKNMILDIYDPTIELPGCCGTTQKIRLLKNIGLIRCILTSYVGEDDDPAVDLFNIQLDDVYLNTGSYAIDNIGSLVGIIDSEGDVNIGGSPSEKAISSFTDIRIKSKGNNIGGIVGELESKGDVTIKGVEVESVEKNNSYIHGSHIIGKNNVGGLVGRLTYDEAYIGNEPSTGSSHTETTSTTVYHPLSVGVDNSKKCFQGDGSVFYDLEGKHKVGDDENVPNDMNDFRTKLHELYNLVDGSFVQVPETAEDIDTEVNYYTKKDGKYTSIGKLKWGKDESETYTYTDSKNRKQTYTGNGSDLKEKSGADYVSPTITFPGGFNVSGYTYYVAETVTGEKTVVDGGDYPTGLTVENAKVNFDNAAFDGLFKGIIVAQEGSNAGGMIGFATVEGATTMEKQITMTVPTITATTEATRASLSAKAPANGNNAGGLVGNYQNVSDSKDTKSKFAGTIKARKGIVAMAARAGGVLGEQRTVMFTHTVEDGAHVYGPQVLIGDGAEAKVTIGDLIAVNGLAGGLIGYQESGKVKVAGGNNVEINITKISASHNAGGAIGESNDDAFLAIDNKTLKATTGDMVITKGSSYFPTTAYRNYFGTFGTLVGEKQHWLEIGKSGANNVTAKVADGNLLTDTKKDELLFGLNGTAATTEIFPTSKKFWGDENGYLGHAKESSQYIVKGAVQQGNYDFNVFKKY